MTVVALAIAARAATDTDIWGHLRFGLDILSQGRLPAVDPYSFTSAQPWVNHEWLGQVLLALTYDAGGLPLLVVYRILVLGSFLWIVHVSLRSTAWPLRDVLLLATAVAVVPLSSTVRPQLHSLPLYALTLWALPREPRWLPLVFLAWANLHGSWMLGLGAVGVWTVLHPSVRRFTLFAACLLATLLNPYGFGLWWSLLDAIQHGWGHYTEWQPITEFSLGADAAVLWTSAVGLGIWAWRRRPAGRFETLWTVMVAVAAFQARRHVPLFAVTSVMLLAAPIAGSPPSLAGNRWSRQTLAVAAAALLASGLLAVQLLWSTATCLPPPSGRAIRPESSAVHFIRSAGLHGRALMWFDWGFYAIWHVGDVLRVSIDNRRETVTDQVIADHTRFYRGDDPEYAERIGADYVWLPPDFAPVSQLEERGWFRLYEGPRSVILGRTESPLVVGVESSVPPCFPGL